MLSSLGLVGKQRVCNNCFQIETTAVKRNFVKYLLATDGSEAALCALRSICYLLQPRDEVVVYTATASETVNESGFLQSQPLLKELLTEEKIFYVNETNCDPKTSVLKVCQKHDVDITVTGSRGLGPLQGAWAGSLTHNLLYVGLQNVLVVRSGGSEDAAHSPFFRSLKEKEKENQNQIKKDSGGLLVEASSYCSSPSAVYGEKAEEEEEQQRSKAFSSSSSSSCRRFLLCADGSTAAVRAAKLLGRIVRFGDHIVIYSGFTLPPITASHRSSSRSYDAEVAPLHERSNHNANISKALLMESCSDLTEDSFEICSEGSDDPKSVAIEIAMAKSLPIIVCGCRGMGAVHGAVLGSFGAHLVQNAVGHAVLIVQQ